MIKNFCIKTKKRSKESLLFVDRGRDEKDNKFTYFTSIDGKILIVNNDKKKCSRKNFKEKNSNA